MRRTTTTLLVAATAAAALGPVAAGARMTQVSGGVLFTALNDAVLAPTFLLNISTRLQVGTDENVLIGGFILRRRTRHWQAEGFRSLLEPCSERRRGLISV